MRATLSSRAASLVGLPSTVTMMSPGLNPALSAGEPANTVVMTRPALPSSKAAPMPEYWPPQLVLGGLGLLGWPVDRVRVIERLEGAVHARLAELVDVDGLVVAALQLLDDALLELPCLLGGVRLAAAEPHGVLAVQVPAGEVAAEEAEGHDEHDDEVRRGRITRAC